MKKQKHFFTVLLFCAWPGAGAIHAQSTALPQLRPRNFVEDRAVYVGDITYFFSNPTGDAPLSFQWRLDGRDLAAQTNRTLKITSAQAADEGDYTLLVSNPFGQVASSPAHLFVVPAMEWPLHNYTNELGKKLPYTYVVPQNYNLAPGGSLFINMAGAGLNQDNYRDYLGAVAPWAAGVVLTSYRESVRRPTIVLWPLRRSGEDFWNVADMALVVGIINQLVTQYSIATNQIHLFGYSDGGGASVALLEKYPGLFASAFLVSGTGSTTKPSLFKHVPLWVFHAADDSIVSVASSRNLVSALRRAGGTPIYSEFASGDHFGPDSVARVTPFLLDWLMDQRLGAAPTERILLINSPTEVALYTTGAASLTLAGSVEAAGEGITGVSWENTTSKTKGQAIGANNWTTPQVPLAADKTNTIVVTATTTLGWAPAYGGSTTLSETLSVVSTPVRASLIRVASGALLNWTGGVAPFRIQRTSALAETNWIDTGTNATPPLTLSLDQPLEFYQVIGH